MKCLVSNKDREDDNFFFLTNRMTVRGLEGLKTDATG